MMHRKVMASVEVSGTQGALRSNYFWKAVGDVSDALAHNACTLARARRGYGQKGREAIQAISLGNDNLFL